MTGGRYRRSARRLATVGAFSALLSLTTAACGGGSPLQAPSAAPESSTVAAAPTTYSTEEQPTEDQTTEAPTPTEDSDTSEPSEDETPKPPVLTKDVSGRDLTTADFFKLPDGWQDGRFSAAGKQDVPGVSGTIEDCADEADTSTPAVELRLANNFSKISMVVAQGDDSEQSDAVLNVRAEGNGTYKDTAHVPFNTTKTFSVDVSGVNAFKLQFWLSGKKCRYDQDVRVVLTNLRVE